MIERIDGTHASNLFLKKANLGNYRSTDFLRGLAREFSKLPYENLSKIVKVARVGSPHEALRLPHEVLSEHFEYGFGGTCFSLTFLLERILRACGFKCYKVMADMRSGKNVHCLVIVEERDARFMIDPGYAIYELIELPRFGSTMVSCPHAIVEVISRGEEIYDVWTIDPSGRKWRYRFRDVPTSDRQFEGYWIASFSKPTLNNVCLTKLTPQGHIYIRKDFFKFTSLHSLTKKRLRDGLEEVISSEFGIDSRWVDLALGILAKRRIG